MFDPFLIALVLVVVLALVIIPLSAGIAKHKARRDPRVAAGRPKHIAWNERPIPTSEAQSRAER
jgi:hypothetical protein